MTDMETAVDTTIDTAVTDTVPAGTQTASAETEATAQTGADAEAGSGAQDVAEDETGEESEADEGVIFTPVYNGVVVPVKASDTARVVTLLQKGMKFEHMAEDLERLHRLTAVYGAKSIGDMLDMVSAEKEQARLADYTAQYGERAAERLMELEQAQYGTFADADAAADRASLEDLGRRLAREFAELQEMHPHVTDVASIPRDVIDLAIQKHLALADAYNRYALYEQQRAAAAAQKQVANQKAATGSLADSGTQAIDPVWEAFVRGSRRVQS